MKYTENQGTIFGKEFPITSMEYKHVHPGFIGLKNSNSWNKNRSEIYINLTRTPELDGKSEIIGQVQVGYGELRDYLELKHDDIRNSVMDMDKTMKLIKADMEIVDTEVYRLKKREDYENDFILDDT